MDISVKSIFDRIDSAREQVGVSDREIARILEVTLPAVGQWRRGEVKNPQHLVAKLDPLAARLKVPVQWLASGKNPPEWFLLEAMETRRTDIDWISVQPLSRVYDVWFDFLNTKVIEDLLNPYPSVNFPNGFSICRCDFFKQRLGLWAFSDGECKLHKITASELETLAESVGAWPWDNNLRDCLRKMPIVDCSASPNSCSDPKFWEDFLVELEKKSPNLQNEIFDLLTTKLPNEQDLSGEAIVFVLSRCVKVACSAEIIGGMKDGLQRVITIALFDEFRGKTFSIKEMGLYLLKHRSIQMIGRGKTLHEKLSATTVSEDTVVRALRKIAEEIKTADGGDLLIPPSGGQRKWQVRDALLATE